MEISEFVVETIKQVCKGVSEASLECSQSGVIVNPPISVGEDGNYSVPRNALQRRVEKIYFDIAVEVTEKSGQAGVAIQVLSDQENTPKDVKNSTASHISFSIPVCLPTQDCSDK
jgi:hypothetical protein